MAKVGRSWRHAAPWLVSIGLMLYVFTVATDWDRLREATAEAHLWLFLAFATIDRLAFFVVWTLLQAAALRRFALNIPLRSIIAVRGGSELLRAVSNPLSDGAFFLGLTQLAGGRIEPVLAAALIPAICHFLILMVQMTLALPFLPGGAEDNRDVMIASGVMWGIVLGVSAAIRLSATRGLRVPAAARARAWLQQFPLRELRPFLVGFVVLAVFDVLIQGLAARAFQLDIPWIALAARIPLLYLALSIPSLGNFGTREIAFAELFSEFGERHQLIAFAFAVNAVFLVLNVLIGLIFLQRALELMAEVRRAKREGQRAPTSLLHDPTDL